MSSRQWRKLAAMLAPQYRVIAPDFIGSGDEPPWPADREFAWGMDVERLAQRIDELDEPVHVVGHSYGGLVAATLARHFPDRIRSLCAYDPVAFGVLHSEHDAVGLADLDRVESNPLFLDRERGGSAAWLEVFVDYWNAPGTWKAMAPAAREAFLRVGRKVFWEVYSLAHDRTPASAYAQVTAPALLLTGQDTPAAAQRVVALLAQTLPRGRQERIAAAGHMGPITHADTVNVLIEKHLASSVG